MQLNEGIDNYLGYMVMRRFTPKHIGHVRSRLKEFQEIIGDIDLNEVTFLIIQKYLRTPRLEKLSRGTYNHYIAHCKKLFEYLHNMGYMSKNPAMGLEFVKEEQRIIEYLTVDEIRKLLKCRYPYQHNKEGYQIRDQLAFRLAIYCGLRSGEIVHLKWSDISWDQKEMFIRSSKNLKDRIVPIPKDYKKLMKWLKAAYYTRRGACFHYSKHRQKHEYILDGYSYGYKSTRIVTMQKNTLNQALRRNLEYCGIKKKWPHMHMLRHTCATMYLRGKPGQRGMDMRVIGELLGHSSPRSTMIYTHVDKSLLVEEMERALSSTPFSTHSFYSELTAI